jgi:hypothetical protein
MTLSPAEEAEYRQLKKAKELADQPPTPEPAPTLSDVLRYLVRHATVPNERTELAFLKAIDDAEAKNVPTTPTTSTTSDAGVFAAPAE